jgi:hypothetical protein
MESNTIMCVQHFIEIGSSFPKFKYADRHGRRYTSMNFFAYHIKKKYISSSHNRDFYLRTMDVPPKRRLDFG